MLEDLLADLTSGDEARAETAAVSLAEFGDAALPSLTALLDSPEADSRWWAARTLASLPGLDPGVFPPLLADAAPEVRQCAALALCSHPSQDAIPSLIGALSDEDSLTAELAAKALTFVGEPAVESLLQVLNGAAQSARIHAMHALSEIADPRSIPAMIAAMSEESAMLHYWADAGLERLGVNMVYLKP